MASITEEFLGSINTGVLQIANGVALDSTLRNVTDQNGNASTLSLSTTQASFTGSITLASTNATGFLGLRSQATGTVATPSTGVNVFANASGQFGWVNSLGFTRSFGNPSATSNLTFTLPSSSGTLALTDVAQTYSANGVASAPAAMTLTGTPFVGTGNTSYPLFYFNGGTAPTTWNNLANGGTYIGINATSTFAGNFIDFRQNGSASIFSINVYGGMQTGIGATSTFRGNIQLQGNFTTYNKGGTGYLTFITRNTSGSETLMDFTNVGTLAASGAISIGNTITSAIGIASTHKVTMVIGGTTYYLLASNV